MRFSSFTFFVTEDCNFSCSYCYQKKTTKYLGSSILIKALDFFWPFFEEKTFINFYGGEPLLAFDKIREAIDYIQAKIKTQERQIQYTITTNGSLIDDHIMRFLNQHKFSLLLSFDGVSQDKSRKKGSFHPLVSIIKKLREYPDIHLETNSVFTPETVGHLSQSIHLITDLGITNAGISLSQTSSWNPSSLVKLKEALDLVRELCYSTYKRTGGIPVIEFREKSKKGIFSCYAGKDRMAMTPDGELWGCYLFTDHFNNKPNSPEYRKYYFGDLQSFVQNHEIIYPEILLNYSKLRMDRFLTPCVPCLLCDDLRECEVCPMDNLFSSPDIRKVSAWMCETTKILRKENRLLWEEIHN